MRAGLELSRGARTRPTRCGWWRCSTRSRLPAAGGGARARPRARRRRRPGLRGRHRGRLRHARSASPRCGSASSPPPSRRSWCAGSARPRPRAVPARLRASRPTRRSGSGSCTPSRRSSELDAAVDAVVADLLAGGPEALAETKLLLDEVSAPAAPGAGRRRRGASRASASRDEAQAGIRASWSARRRRGAEARPRSRTAARSACGWCAAASAAGVEAIAAHVAGEADAPYVAAADGAVEVAGVPRRRRPAPRPRVRRAATRCTRATGSCRSGPSWPRPARAAGVVFVGPSPDGAARARRQGGRARTAPSRPASRRPGGDRPAAIGFPLLVKAAAGGGGRGMRVVRERRRAGRGDGVGRARGGGGLRRRARCTSSATSRAPRHVEVQVFGDGHGGGVHLGLRDCSLQRRHQKVIEEAPAPGVPRPRRAALGEAACRLLRVGRLRRRRHGRVAARADGADLLPRGERAPAGRASGDGARHGHRSGALQLADRRRRARCRLRSMTWRPQGHAVEARLVAEDPTTGSCPPPGRCCASTCRPACASTPAYRAGQEVPTTFDGLLAKLVAHGADRTEALDRLAAALDETVVLGVPTNLPLLRALVRRSRRRAPAGSTRRSSSARTPWRRRAVARPRRARRGRCRPAHGRFRVGLATCCRRCPPRSLPTVPCTCSRTAATGGCAARRRAATWRRPRRGPAAGGGGGVSSPMPGRVLAVTCAVGDHVAAGAVLVVLEAMKMEHPVTRAVRRHRRRRAAARPATRSRPAPSSCCSRPGALPDPSGGSRRSPFPGRSPESVADPRFRPCARLPGLRRVRGCEPARRRARRRDG